MLASGHLASVVRFGYGQYDGLVRVLGPRESVHDWRAGTWISLDSVAKIRFPVPCRATQEVVSANRTALTIPAGTCGEFMSFDKEGDLIMAFDVGKGRRRVYVYIEDAAAFEFG